MNIERRDMRKVRALVQVGFLLLSILIGWEFYRFTYQFAAPGATLIYERPAGVDAFLPIGALLAVKHFTVTYMIDPFHPAGMFVFLSAIFVSVAARKGFCGWICPVGTVSEYFWKLGRRVFGRNFDLPFLPDLLLRSLKYMLLTLILFLAVAMPFLYMFFISEYYRMVDVHMLMLFVNISTVTATVLIVLVALGVFIKNFWCRYLCPYGALLGLGALFSPFAIRRNDEHCTHCMSCTKNCPSMIEVEKEKSKVSSPECFGCLTCVSKCPAEGALELTYKLPGSAPQPVKRLWVYPLIVVGAFYLLIAIAMLTGNWQTKTPMDDYRRLVLGIINKDQSSSSISNASSSSAGPSPSAAPSNATSSRP